MISQIESGTTNPSVSTLYAISTVLRISTDILIAGVAGGTAADRTMPASSQYEGRALRDQRGQPGVSLIQHPEGRKAINLERGVRWELLTPVPETDVEFMEVTYAVGGGSIANDHAIRHNGREYSIILEGRLAVQIGFEEYELKPGDSMTFDSTIPHRFWNAGNVPVRAIWFVLDRWRDMMSS